MSESKNHYADSSEATQLREANEQLVIAALRAQSDAASATKALDEASRTIELDPLTQLPNRALMLDRFAHAIASAKRHGTRLALLFLDLNNFKQINDTLGHAVGDEVLQFTAQALTAAVREEDTVSRHGGDEFLILLCEITDIAAARVVAKKITAALLGPLCISSNPIRIEASIGIALYPDDAEDIAQIIDLADAAMFRAKRLGVDCCDALSDVVGNARGSSFRALPSGPSETAEESVSDQDRENRIAQLRDANEQLVLSALNAQELLSAAEQVNGRQTRFLAMAAHELRNPLTPLLYVAELLGRVQPGDLPKMQSIIERQVAHMARLVSDLVDVSRVNTGKLRLERRRTDMRIIIDQAVDAIRGAIDQREQRLSIDVPSYALLVDADRDRLVQVFSNLLDNASKYTPKGGDIGLSVAAATEIVVTVFDNGLGMSPDALLSIFEPFMQSAEATSFNGVGLGIGLTVVRELVLAHGGAVVASSPGKGGGSRFTVTLPRVTTKEVTQNQSPDVSNKV